MIDIKAERLREWGKEVDVQYRNRMRGNTSKADELYEIARLWANGTTGETRENAHALFLLELREVCDEVERRDAVLKMALEAFVESCGDRCNAEYNPCHARLAIDAIKGVLG